MYRTKDGEDIFIIDGHTHFWDGSPANQKNVHGKQFQHRVRVRFTNERRNELHDHRQRRYH